MAEDISRATSGVLLPAEVSQEIWSNLQEQSIVMQLARRTEMPGPGTSVQVVTGDPEAEWVGETALKPVSRSTLDTKTIKPYKLAVIEPFSNEFERDAARLFRELQSRLPGALSNKFDNTVFFGPPPGSGFDTFAGVQSESVTSATAAGAYKGLTKALGKVVDGGGDVESWVLSPSGEINFLDQLDGNDRPIFTVNPASDGTIGALVGRPVRKSKAVHKGGSSSPAVAKTFGFGGEWSSAVWGSVEGVKVTRLTESTLVDGTIEVEVDGGEGGTVTIPKLLHLAQQNMFALRVEIEVGFAFRSIDRFVRLTGPNSA